MKVNIVCLPLTTLYILYCISGKAIEGMHTWHDNLITSLKQNTEIKQLLLLYEDDLNNNEIHQLAKNISRTIPTMIADFIDVLGGNSQRIMLSSHLLRVTTVIVIPTRYTYKNASTLANLLDAVANMTYPKTCPKVIIALQVGKGARYQEFFKLLWSKKFLDVTILEFRLLNEGKPTFVARSIPKIANLIYYNPFTDSFFKTVLSKDSILFPNKLRDLNRYKMKIALFHYPPYVYVLRNSTGHVLDFHGPDVNLLLFLENDINFSKDMVIFNLNRWPTVNCTKEFLSTMRKKSPYGGAEFCSIQTGMMETCYNPFFQFVKGTRMLRYIFLVPILSNEIAVIQTEWNLLNIMSILCLISMPWLIAKYLNFDRRYWEFTYAVLMVFGLAIPKEPKRSVERILFISMLAFFFFQSSYVFTALSNLQLQKEIFKGMETFEDVLSANLTVVMHGNQVMMDDDNSAYHKMMRNAIYSRESLEECTRILIDYGNVSCFCREDQAHLIFQKISNRYDQPRMKILKDTVQVLISAFIMEGGSPYTDRMKSVVSALVESGISDKWDAAYIPKAEVSQSQIEQFKQECILTSKGLIFMMILVLLGCSCSFLVFAAEILVYRQLNNKFSFE